MWVINPTPEGTVGVQQLLKPVLSQKITHCISVSFEVAPFRVSNFAIVDEGNAVTSAYCNDSVCILKEPESYEQLKSGLHDLCADVGGISKNVISVDEELYHIRFYLG